MAARMKLDEMVKTGVSRQKVMLGCSFWFKKEAFSSVFLSVSVTNLGYT
jgi:hypothetical protein